MICTFNIKIYLKSHELILKASQRLVTLINVNLKILFNYKYIFTNLSKLIFTCTGCVLLENVPLLKHFMCILIQFLEPVDTPMQYLC